MKDYLVRATAADAQVRAFAATTRQTVETARQNHNTSPVVTAALGRLLTAGAMMGSMLKGKEDLLTLQVTGDGLMGGMTVTADSRGGVKGYANEPQVILPANSQGKLDEGVTPEGLLELVLEGMDFQFLETRDVEFSCGCSKERVEKALISIGREEIGNMIADGETIEVKCHFCNKGYHFSIPELKGILEKCGNK